MNLITSTATFKSVARVSLATLLLLGLLASALPFESLASEPTCQLSCCAGRAPHAAGSCMHGSCRAVLRKRPSHNHHAGRVRVSEQLCGLNSFVKSQLSAKRLAENSARKDTPSSKREQLSSTVVSKPCEAGCGSCGTGFSTSYRHRNLALTAHAQQPRPPSSVYLSREYPSASETLDALFYTCGPRAPPSSLS